MTRLERDVPPLTTNLYKTNQSVLHVPLTGVPANMILLQGVTINAFQLHQVGLKTKDALIVYKCVYPSIDHLYLRLRTPWQNAELNLVTPSTLDDGSLFPTCLHQHCAYSSAYMLPRNAFVVCALHRRTLIA